MKTEKYWIHHVHLNLWCLLSGMRSLYTQSHNAVFLRKCSSQNGCGCCSEANLHMAVCTVKRGFDQSTSWHSCEWHHKQEELVSNSEEVLLSTASKLLTSIRHTRQDTFILQRIDNWLIMWDRNVKTWNYKWINLLQQEDWYQILRI